MSLVSIVAPSPGDGKTTVAVALAYRLLSIPDSGRRVSLLRVQGPNEDPARAACDATVLAAVEGAQAAPAPVDSAEVSQRANSAGRDIVTIAEVPADAAREIGSKAETRFLVVVSGISEASLERAQALASDLGGRTAAVAVLVPRDREADAPSVLADRGLDCAGVLAEDALLAAPRVSELARALEATYLHEDGDLDQAAEHLMLGPIGSDPGQPYFGRHDRKAVIVRFDKTDVQLAAISPESSAPAGGASPPPTCLILTGGGRPSPYLLDRVGGEDIPVLLTRHETADAMRALEDAYGTTRLGGGAKLERLRQLSLGLDVDRLLALLN